MEKSVFEIQSASHQPLRSIEWQHQFLLDYKKNCSIPKHSDSFIHSNFDLFVNWLGRQDTHLNFHMLHEKGNFIFLVMLGPYILYRFLQPRVTTPEINSEEIKTYLQLIENKNKISKELFEEKFFFLSLASVLSCPSSMKNGQEDILNTLSIIRSHCENTLAVFPESYPFYHFSKSPNAELLNNSITGSYRKNQSCAFLHTNRKVFEFSKVTAYGKEITSDSLNSNFLYEVDGFRMAVLICYDFLNPFVIAKLSQSLPDFVVVLSAIALGDEKRIESFVLVRGHELQCPILFVSGENLEKSSRKISFYYDAIKQEVKQYEDLNKISIPVGTRLTKCPQVHWRTLLGQKLLPPFTEDFKNLFKGEKNAL